MKYYILIFSLFCNAVLHAQDIIPVKSEITDVTVFLNGAQVTRTASVSLKAGENILSFEGLAQGINPQSINVEGSSDFLIKSVNHEANFLENAEKSSETKELEEQLEDLDFKLKTRTSLERVYSEEKNLLLANKSMKGNNETLIVDDLREMASYFREHLEELEYKILELAIEKKEIQEKRNQLQMELNKSRNNFNKYTSKIELALGADRNKTTEVQFSYIVYNASWYATYDVRTTEVDKPVQLIYNANISQYTGVDWSDVKITLSTGNPMVNGNKPNLTPWYISVYDADASYRNYQSNQNRNKRAQEPQADEIEVVTGGIPANYGFYAKNALGNVSMVTESVESLITTEFKISIPYDIPTDGESYDVEIQRSDLSSGYSYYAAPGLDKDAYLLARLTNFSELNLLPGDANVFYQGSFVGTSFLDPYATEDTLDISLGKDKSIVISREKVEEFCKTSSFGGNKKTTRTFKIVVKNTKSTAVSLKLEDQIPISQRNDITVTPQELSEGILDEKTGIISWELELATGETKELQLQFEVKYPKKVKLARL